MKKSLTEILDSAAFQGLAVVNVHTGFNVSIEFEVGRWSPHEFGCSPGDAIVNCFNKHAPKAPATLAPPPY